MGQVADSARGWCWSIWTVVGAAAALARGAPPCGLLGGDHRTGADGGL